MASRTTDQTNFGRFVVAFVVVGTVAAAAGGGVVGENVDAIAGMNVG